MKINMCIPTRGKPEYLRKYLTQSLVNAILPDTRIVIGFDEDDKTLDKLVLPNSAGRIIPSIAPREDSLGEKYARCAAAYPASIYVMGLDDVGITTRGWDHWLTKAVLELGDGIGWMYMGKEPHGEPFPSFIATTEKTIEAMGYFVPPHFPSFWFCNTWLHEIAEMTEKLVTLDGIEVQYPERMPATYKRDLPFWAWFFEQTRAFRAADAIKLGAPNAMERFPVLREKFSSWTEALRNPVNAKAILQLERPTVEYIKEPNEEGEDARYTRLTMRALKTIESMAA